MGTDRRRRFSRLGERLRQSAGRRDLGRLHPATDLLLPQLADAVHDHPPHLSLRRADGYADQDPDVWPVSDADADEHARTDADTDKDEHTRTFADSDEDKDTHAVEDAYKDRDGRTSADPDVYKDGDGGSAADGDYAARPVGNIQTPRLIISPDE